MEGHKTILTLHLISTLFIPKMSSRVSWWPSLMTAPYLLRVNSYEHSCQTDNPLVITEESFKFFPPVQVLICNMLTWWLWHMKKSLTSGFLRKHTLSSGLEPWATSFHRDSDPGTSRWSDPKREKHTIFLRITHLWDQARKLGSHVTVCVLRGWEA